MKILVAIKRTIDHNVKINVLPGNKGVELDNIKMSMNPFCKIAVEEAIRLKEAGIASEIVAVTLGIDKCQDILRAAQAMGIDRSILIETEETNLEPLAIAKTLKEIVNKENPNLILMGKQSIDAYNNQTGQMLAALLGWGQGTFASKIEKNDDNTINVTRKTDEGSEVLNLKTPCVITADLNLNKPRYASLPNIIKASKKPLEIISINDLEVDITPRITTIEIVKPMPRPKGIKVDSVTELIDKLKNEAKVI